MTATPRGKILVVEDDVELRFILMARLEALGFQVFEASDGEEGVARARDTLPDIIIMDIGLPKMDGVAATSVLKAAAETEHIPIIMLTARSRTQDVIRGLDAGAQEYIAKPFDMMELLARVETMFRLVGVRKDLAHLNTELEAEVASKTTTLRTLYEFTRDLNRASSRDEILDLILRCVADMTGAKRISILLKTAKGDFLRCVRAKGMDASAVEPMKIDDARGIVGQVMQSGKTYAARTYGTGLRSATPYDRTSFVSTPLTATSADTVVGLLGVLNATEKEDSQPFTDEEAECIRSIADAGAIAIEAADKHQRLEHSVRILLQTVGRLAEFRDEETNLHLERVAKMAGILAAELAREGRYADRINDDYVNSLVQAAPMHDIGKVGIPDEILTKPGKLTDEEFQIMKTHADIGRRVLSQALDPAHPVPLLNMCIDIAHAHHERYDGTGYPRRIAGEKIPLAARIIALVDAYDAITSKRRYKAAQSHEDAVEIIRSEAGKHFDPVIVDGFLRCNERFDAVHARWTDEDELPPIDVA